MRLGVLIVAVLGASACGFNRGVPDGSHFSREVGRATAVEVLEKAHRVLLQHQFEIEQELGPPQILILTRWRDRHPYSDEINAGIDAAQIRATVRARTRSDGGMDIYIVHLLIEQRVRTAMSEAWITHTVTPSAVRYAEEITADLRRQLNIGVHR